MSEQAAQDGGDVLPSLDWDSIRERVERSRQERHRMGAAGAVVVEINEPSMSDREPRVDVWIRAHFKG
jgi:hypothetical protein